MSKRKKNAIVILSALGLVFFFAAAIWFFSRLEQRQEIAPYGAGLMLSRTNENDIVSVNDAVSGDHEMETIFYNGQKYIYKERLTTLLILGIDDYDLETVESGRNQSQADFLLLAVFDPDNSTCTLIQLNRDTMCDIPMLDANDNFTGYAFAQLALAHTYGSGQEESCDNTVNAVSRLLYGAEIDNYFALTMNGIPILNDLVGGVEVTIEDDFSMVDSSLAVGEKMILTGDNVESFVRSRRNMNDSSNLARMKRQREYIMSLFDALRDANNADPAFPLDAYAAIADYLITDCSIDELSDYAERFSGYNLSGIVTTEGEAVAGNPYMTFYVDESALQELVIRTFYEKSE